MKKTKTKDDLSFDCISRKRAIERLKLNLPISDGADNSRDRHRYMQSLADIQAIRELPPVTPQEPRKGHWMPRNSFLVPYKCSECNYESERYDNFCPNCGAKMIEPQESEGKDD